MRTIITLVFFFVSWFMLVMPAYAQLVIEYDNFPKPESYDVFRFEANTANIQIPAGGEDQLWDYSNLQIIDSTMSIFLSAEGDTTFVGAKYITPRELIFQGFTYNSFVYEAIDENGIYELGRLPQDTSFSITPISGGQNDIIRFVGTPLPFEGRLDLIKFPLSYQDAWTESFTENTIFELTVAGFGLNMVPGSRKRTTTQTRTVIGWGQLITPNKEGGSNEPRDVLLMQGNGVTVDSFFLGGAPAPQPLLDAFGLSQGDVNENEFYLFFDQYDQSNLMRVNVNNTTVTSAFFKPDRNEVSTSVSAFELTPTVAYPNPISPLQELTIQTDQLLTNGTFVLLDMNGRHVHLENFNTLSNDKITISLPGYLMPGLYIFQLTDSVGEVRGIGKINVH